MRRALIALVPLAACGAPEGTASPPTKTAEESVADLPQDPGLPGVTVEPVTPSMSADEAAAALSAALGSPPDSTETTAAYRMLMAQGDEYCPGNEYYITDIHLYGCDSSTGYHFAGISDWLEEEVDAGLNAWLEGVAGDFWIVTPDGELFEAGGHSVYISGDTFWMRELAGSWLWQGGDPWIASGFSGSLIIEEEYARGIRMSGGAQIQGVSWSATELMLPAGCDYGPVGRLGLRDPGGGWYTMVFEDCEPCATVMFEETELGEACVDFAPFLAAMEAMR